MKPRALFSLFVMLAHQLLAIVFSLGCGDEVVSQKKPDAVSSFFGATIPHDSLPRPFTGDIYFRYFFPESAEMILSRLQSNGFTLRNAWEANGDGPCMRLEPTILIVQLMQPNPGILAHGFTTDSSRAALSCTSTWRHYKF